MDDIEAALPDIVLDPIGEVQADRDAGYRTVHGDRKGPAYPDEIAITFRQLLVRAGRKDGDVVATSLESGSQVTNMLGDAARICKIVRGDKGKLHCWPLVTRAIDVRPIEMAPDLELPLDPEPTHGPVLITVDYRVPVENADAFREAMERVGRSRQRTGAERWGLYQDGVDTERFLEAYVVPTWEEHLRQHQERYTRSDAMYLEEARKLLKPGTVPKVDHLLFAYAGE